MSRLSILGSLCIALGVLATPSIVHADGNPWEQGVPRATQDKAYALFVEGNALFGEQAHKPALEKYKEAVALWDHPAIHLNKAKTELALELYLDAADDFEAALKYGFQPYASDPDGHYKYDLALSDQKLVGKLIGDLEVTCGPTGGQITVDAAQWIACPGTKKQRVLAGNHTVVGESSGYLTQSRKVTLVGGTTESVKIDLVSEASVQDRVQVRYATRRWIPWTVASAGVPVLVGGLAVWLSGRREMDRYESDLKAACPFGCPKDLGNMPYLKHEHDDARFKGGLGLSLMVAGGAVTAAGIVWVVINRPQRVVPTVGVTPEGASASLSVTF